MGRFGGGERAELVFGGGVDVLRVLPLDRDGGVWGLDVVGVRDLQPCQWKPRIRTGHGSQGIKLQNIRVRVRCTNDHVGVCSL